MPPDPRAATGSWAERPAGVPATVPPPSVPLSFLFAAAVGLVGCGVAWVLARSAAANDPTADPVVAAVHLGVLATLATGILGATHQFAPVITGRPLRSVPLARATLISFVAASWMLPLGVATQQLAVTAISGALTGLALVLLAVNLSGPLAARGKGAPVLALRIALVGALVTGFLGIAFIGDRQGNWFALAGHVDLAMGVLGIFGWLGMTYLGVAEKLWPMFMLAHVPGPKRAGHLAVVGVGSGLLLATPGLAWSITVLAWIGAALMTAGLGAHLWSLTAHVAHRRRKADLHLLFVITAASWLVLGAALSLAAAVSVHKDPQVGTSLTAAAVAAFGGWLLEALVGHSYKVVPFILWSALRSRSISSGPAGKPLMFSDLFDRRAAGAAYVSVTLAMAALCIGLGAAAPTLVAVAGALLAVTGVVVAVSLMVIPLRMIRHASSTTAVTAERAGPASR
ncbi:MAG: hypothetical protein M0004_13220 [Actinomycetota bacterium]|nr:hypothetical protein [Actinomycetota bacterium]